MLLVVVLTLHLDGGLDIWSLALLRREQPIKMDNAASEGNMTKECEAKINKTKVF